jgi:hypothetical protein
MDDVTATVLVEGGCSGPNRRTQLRLSWRRDDPLAVTLLVTAQPAHPALPSGRWSVLRDMLRDSLDRPVGIGDVRLSPDRLRDRLRFTLTGDGTRECVVSVTAATVRSFLDATEGIVRAGDERTGAVDTLIARLSRT